MFYFEICTDFVIGIVILKSVLEVTNSHFNPSRNGNATAEEQKPPGQTCAIVSPSSDSKQKARSAQKYLNATN